MAKCDGCGARRERDSKRPAMDRAIRAGGFAALLFGLALAAAPVGVQSANAQTETGLPVPRFVSLKADEVNMRAGPGDQYPIEWVYRRRGLPVEIVAEFDNWRRVRLHDRFEGWVHRQLLAAQRTIIVQGEIRTIHAEPAAWSPPVARVEPGVILQVSNCDREWCAVSADGRRGWFRKVEGWGVYPEERIE